jgi:hypothetical protein
MDAILRAHRMAVAEMATADLTAMLLRVAKSEADEWFGELILAELDRRVRDQSATGREP